MANLQDLFRGIATSVFSGRIGSQRRSARDLVRFGGMLHARGFVAATDGNLSIRMDAERIMITPSGFSKGMMKPQDMVIVDFDGRKVSGRHAPSSEAGMHLTIYKSRPDIGAVVHAHPCTATAFATAGIALDEPLCTEVVITLGAIPLAPYGTTGTEELAESLKPFIADYDAILMANHGVVTYGEDLRRAYMKMETVEHYAQIVLATRRLGGSRRLGAAEMGKLLEMRLRYAKKARLETTNGLQRGHHVPG